VVGRDQAHVGGIQFLHPHLHRERERGREREHTWGAVMGARAPSHTQRVNSGREIAVWDLAAGGLCRWECAAGHVGKHGASVSAT
jgi:hypothetical protein